MTPLHGIACFYDFGFGARAVSRKTPIYFMIEPLPMLQGESPAGPAAERESPRSPSHRKKACSTENYDQVFVFKSFQEGSIHH